MSWTGSERLRSDDKGCSASAAAEYVVPPGISAEIKSDKLNAQWRPYTTTKTTKFTRMTLDGKQHVVFSTGGYLLRVHRDSLSDPGQASMAGT